MCPDFVYTGYTQKNVAISKVNKKFISQLTRAQPTPSAEATVQVSHALIKILQCVHPGSSGATALQGLGRQSGRRRSAKLVPTFAGRGVSRGQRNGSPRPLISVYRTWIATYFIQVAPQLTSLGSQGWCTPFQTHCHSEKSGSAGNRTRDHCICSQIL